MENTDIYRVSSSFRIDSSSLWRNTGVEAFSRSSREEDDEEALKWAALEKLPTYNRLKKGLWSGSQGAASEIDVDNLGYQERKNLLERLVKVAEEDNEKFLLKVKDRIDRVGIDMPKVEVRYEHLTIDAEAYVGSRALPTFINFCSNIVEVTLPANTYPKKEKKNTLPANMPLIFLLMTLLLGPPASGKTTLLLALAGKLDSDLKVSGRVTYNGHDLHEFVPQRTAAYISQHDVHIGEMTVREALAFSARCQGVGSRYEMLAELSRREKAANIKPDPDLDIYMKAVATEGQEANVITDYILKFVHILNGTTVISLLQPAPETYDLFDDIILLSDGQIVYQGPREDVLDFFESMGFRCPERKGVADFLQEVTSRKDQGQYWVRKDEPYRFVTVKEFAEAFQSFPSLPKWWEWYYWVCPVAWTLYGLLASQFGDNKEMMVDRNETVEQFLKDYFDFKHDFLGVVAAVVLGFVVLFAFVFAFAIKSFNFQRR
ncbi:hypothetical protein L1049_001810 [Liquidambar formosana]|uniref:Uncharacterized protein n=1 Tax=Liquidambar formosana TaxID=63359 RepID=A0AAP0N587_LIQFO